jgi:hypothetical protein
MNTVTILSLISVSIIIIIGIGLSFFLDPSWISKNLKDFKQKQQNVNFTRLQLSFKDAQNTDGSDISKIFNLCQNGLNTPEDNTDPISCDGVLKDYFNNDFA